MYSYKQKAAAALIIISTALKKKNKAKKKCWIKPWVDRRRQLGAGSTLTRELQIEDAQQFRDFCRLTTSEIEYIIQSVGPTIFKMDTKLREAIPVRERVLVTLRFLASGDSYGSIQYLFRIPVCTIGRIVRQVFPAIFNSLKDKYLKFPQNEKDWLDIAKEYENRWNFPHCIGSLDGKHIVMQAPYNSGSLYYNYKGSHSIVLMAVVDANCKFIYIDVGCNGRISDGGVLFNTSLHDGLTESTIILPDQKPLPGRNKPVPYCFVADDAFAMTNFILKPYPFRNQPAPNRIFNNRLSRARRIVENAFGIIANRFRVLRKPMNLNPDRAKDVVMAICTLHNFLLSKNEPHYLNKGMVDSEHTETYDLLDGSWRLGNNLENSFFDLENGTRHNYNLSQKDVRDEFKNYFMTPQGEVPWQYRHITLSN